MGKDPFGIGADLRWLYSAGVQADQRPLRAGFIDASSERDELSFPEYVTFSILATGALDPDFLHPDVKRYMRELPGHRTLVQDVIDLAREQAIVECACRFGLHRSVVVLEDAATRLAEEGYEVHTEHRAVEDRARRAYCARRSTRPWADLTLEARLRGPLAPDVPTFRVGARRSE